MRGPPVLQVYFISVGQGGIRIRVKGSGYILKVYVSKGYSIRA